MIIGIGTDIVEIKRIEKSIQNQSFVNKVYTIDEIKILKRTESFAVNFAGKEAIVKCLGVGFAGISPSDIEILRDENGKPFVNLYNTAKVMAYNMDISNINISLSHTHEYAVAFAVIEKL